MWKIGDKFWWVGSDERKKKKKKRIIVKERTCEFVYVCRVGYSVAFQLSACGMGYGGFCFYFYFYDSLFIFFSSFMKI